jgi:hypothetical protein
MLKEKQEILEYYINQVNEYNKLRDIGGEITFEFEVKHLPDPVVKGFIKVDSVITFKETFSYAKGLKTVDEIKEIVIDRLFKSMLYNSIVTAYSAAKEFHSMQTHAFKSADEAKSAAEEDMGEDVEYLDM